MNSEELLDIVHNLRKNESCSDEQLCDVIKAATQTMNFDVLAEAFRNAPVQKNYSSKSRAIQFSKKELSKMPSHFKKLFIYNNVTAHVRRKSNGVFEIRCSINGVRYSGCSKDLEMAKTKFILNLKSGKQPSQRKQKPKKPMFNDYFMQWLTTVKQPYVKESTYNSYLDLFNRDIKPFFKNKAINEIDSFTVQGYINGFTKAEKYRTAHKLYLLLSPCFEYAVEDELINRNPLAKVVIPKYEVRSGCPISMEEEQKLVEKLRTTRNCYVQALVFLCYTGLRIGELPSVRIDGMWISAISEKKRKGLKDTTRRIPISPVLERMLEYIDVDMIVKMNYRTIGKHVEKYLPGHHTHDLRHTFITRCQEVGIRREIVSIWAGHSADNSITSKIYTHLDKNEKLQLEEIKKFDYDI